MPRTSGRSVVSAPGDLGARDGLQLHVRYRQDPPPPGRGDRRRGKLVELGGADQAPRHNPADDAAA